jgi:hypothetical protein
METQKTYLGINFSSEEADINNIRMSDLFAIAFNKLNIGSDMPSCKAISILLMQHEVKRVEIIKNRQNKYVFDARFYY